MKITVAALIAFYFLTCAKPASAQNKPLVYNSTIYLSAQNIYGLSAQEFFDDYRQYLGGVKTELKYAWSIETGFKMQFWKSFRIGACVSAFRGKFLDQYNTTATVGENVFKRFHKQDFEFLNTPILVTGEFIPYSSSQFRNYYGLGAGISIYEIKWKETVHSDKPFDKRAGNYKTTENGGAPTIRIFTGTELQFDKKWYEKFFTASLMFEAEYTYAFRNVDIFKNAKKGMPEESRLKSSYSMFPGYFGIAAILSFNFNKVDF
ncbi:MAG: hypothetical protein ACM3U1_02130 [Chloroflexota bacterium]